MPAHRNLQRLCAILLVFPAPAFAAGEAWWYYEYERDFVQSLHIMVFVLLALGFEFVWHKAKHYVKDTFYFGMNFRQESGGMHPPQQQQQHPQLMSELVDRMGGEFMTLGFVAFIIFLLNNFGFFGVLADKVNGDENFKLPAEGIDWLHEAEIAHMKLFLAMLFYFLVTSGLVQAAIRKLRKYESLGMKHARQSKTILIPERNWSLMGLENNEDLAEYHGMRQYLLARVGEWRYRRPQRFSDLCTALKVDPEEESAPKHLKEVLDSVIDFSAYIAANLGEGICESIHLHFSTWIGIEVIFALFTVAHWAEVPQTTVIPFFAVMAVLMMILMWMASRQHKNFVLNYETPRRELERRRSSRSSSGALPARGPSRDQEAGLGQRSAPGEIEAPDSPLTGGQRSNRTNWTTASAQTAASRLSNEESIHTMVNTERSVMRCLQTFTFSVCFVCADSVLNAIFPGGSERSVWDIISVPVLLVVVGIITHLQRIIVPRFLVLMALPPFVNEQNFEVLLSVTISRVPQEEVEEVVEVASICPATPSTALSKAGEVWQRRASESNLSASEGAEHVVWELASLVGKREGLEQWVRQRSAASSKAEVLDDLIEQVNEDPAPEASEQHGEDSLASI